MLNAMDKNYPETQGAKQMAIFQQSDHFILLDAKIG